ncbi:site-specific integrase [Candidatus Marinimicrobia bacterium MT.SAG.4]|nr:site-specific integrase [Candidatus Marinimicrobia bacterium MT.SAG.4]
MRLGEIVRKIETGQFSLYSDAPLSSLIKHFQETLQAEDYSDSYHRRLGNRINNFNRYFNREKILKVKQIDYPLLDNYITGRMNSDKIAGKTANMEIDLLKRLFEFGVKHKYLMENPAKELKRKKVSKKEPRYFTHEEIDVLFENAGEYEPFFMVLLHTGLRASDAGNLRWSDINLEQGLLRVIQEKTNSRLTLPINDSLRNYLLDFGTDSAKLFPSLDTDKKREKVRRRIKKILKDEGYLYERVGCHTFRHTFVSHLVINGASIYDVQKLLGHTSIIMTQRYAHLRAKETRRAVDLIDFGPKNVTNSGLRTVVNERKPL